MTTQTTIATVQSKPQQSSGQMVTAGFFDAQSFELMQRVAKAFASSQLVPKAYQNNIANCMIALDLSNRIGANSLMVMQNLYVVHGTPSWSSKFLIATINTCGRFTALRYEWKGKPGADDFGCRAWALEKSTNERLDGVWVTWSMVKAEGWNTKNGSKWNTMPDQMFVYRAAAFWQRAYAPEVGMGLLTSEEVGDVYDAKRGDLGSFEVTLDELRPVEQESVEEEIETDAPASNEVEKPEQKTEPAPQETPQKQAEPAATQPRQQRNRTQSSMNLE